MCDVSTLLGSGSGIGAIGSLLAGQTTASGDQAAAAKANAQDMGLYSNMLNMQQPYISAGQSAAGTMAAGVQPGGQFNSPFTMQDFQQDPAYGFDLAQGQQAVNRSAAANGTLMSGGTMKALTQYSQGMASNEFQNAYQRWLSSNQQRFGNLATTAGLGSTALGQASNLTGNTESAMSGNTMAGLMGAAGATGAGIMGAGNSLASGANSLANMTNMNQLMQWLKGGSGSMIPDGALPDAGSVFDGIGGTSGAAGAGGFGSGAFGAGGTGFSFGADAAASAGTDAAAAGATDAGAAGLSSMADLLPLIFA